MSCNYFEYTEMTDKALYGVALTDAHLNNVTEQIRQYLVNGGAGEVLSGLGIGIRVVKRKLVLLPEEVIYRRFVWISGECKGVELKIHEIKAIGMFLKHGPFYGKCGVPAC